MKTKWEKLLDALAHLREGLAMIQELHVADPEARALIDSRVPMLASVPGAFGIVDGALADLTVKATRLDIDSRRK